MEGTTSTPFAQKENTSNTSSNSDATSAVAVVSDPPKDEKMKSDCEEQVCEIELMSELCDAALFSDALAGPDKSSLHSLRACTQQNMPDSSLQALSHKGKVSKVGTLQDTCRTPQVAQCANLGAMVQVYVLEACSDLGMAGVPRLTTVTLRLCFAPLSMTTLRDGPNNFSRSLQSDGDSKADDYSARDPLAIGSVHSYHWMHVRDLD